MGIIPHRRSVPTGGNLVNAFAKKSFPKCINMHRGRSVSIRFSAQLAVHLLTLLSLFRQVYRAFVLLNFFCALGLLCSQSITFLSLVVLVCDALRHSILHLISHGTST